MALLQVKSVSVQYDERKVLDDVSFEVQESTITALTGKSGSGKTTLLGVLSGLLQPNEGTVLFMGDNIFKWSDLKRSRFRNRDIGFVFQFFNLFSDISAYDNIAFPAILNRETRNLHTRIMELAEYLQITDILDRNPTTLSGGERQRVAIARAIINEPKLILADEPTGNLDTATANDILKLFARLRDDKGISIIIATHDERIVKASNVQYHLENGKILENEVRKEEHKIVKKKPITRPAAKIKKKK
ncbi:MAG: ABC transporter ATP-binding protein [Spirochaetes bacterium]|nr:ABC transporter ATP-binding protein [Spirochaetota bacterium]NMB64980.1 ABC transporter ATP-binding protein [Spirochaetota bacterium]